MRSAGCRTGRGTASRQRGSGCEAPCGAPGGSGGTAVSSSQGRSVSDIIYRVFLSPKDERTTRKSHSGDIPDTAVGGLPRLRRPHSPGVRVGEHTRGGKGPPCSPRSPRICRPASSTVRSGLRFRRADGTRKLNTQSSSSGAVWGWKQRGFHFPPTS